MKERSRASFLFANAAFTPDDGVLRVNGQSERLAPKTAELLRVFLENTGCVLSKRDLMAAVWQDAFVEEGNLTYHIHQLRQSLGRMSGDREYIETLQRRGYRFLPDVVIDESARSEAVPAAVDGGASPTLVEITAPSPDRRPKSRVRRVNVAVAVTLAVVAIPLSRVVLESVRAPSDGPSFTVGTLRRITVDGRIKPSDRPLVRVGAGIVFPWANSSTGLIENGTTREMKQFDGFTVTDYSQLRGEYLAMRIDDPGAVGTIWILPGDGRAPRRLGTVSGDYAVWSPDGSQVAYAWQEQLYVVNYDGGGKRALTGFAGRPAYITWSPDGGSLRFTVNRAINRRIASSLWEMDLNADSAHQLLPDWNIEANQCCGVWSPDGRNFAFTVIQNDRLSLWAFQERRGVWKSEHTRPTRIGPETLNVATPVFSEDGASLWAYVWDSQIELQRYEVQTATLVPHHGGISAVHASYSRDGAWIVYASHPDRSLWRARADGTEPRRLTDGGDVDGCYFSPDGRRIAFRARFNGQQKRVYVIPSDGSGAAEPLTAKDIEQGIPTWSNDGRYLVYGDVAEDFHRPTETRLRVYDFQRRTTDEIPGSAGLWTSRWSPDGKYIAALDRRHEERVMLFDTQSRRWRTLPEATHVDYPNWSSDSAYIYYSASRADGAELRRVSISDGRVQSLINLPAANVSAAYGWAGLTPDDRPLIARLDVPQVSQLELRPH